MEDGVDLGPLPSCDTISLSPVFCDYGSIGFTYPKVGKKFHLLDGRDELEVVPFLNGVARPEYGGLVQEVSGDDVQESAVHTFTGLGYLTLLDEARVYPFEWPSYDTADPSWHFADATAGLIIRSLVLAAQARGTLAGVTVGSFSNTTDSNGDPWELQLSFEVKPGVTLTTVIKNLFDQGMVEFKMVGRDLRMYNAGALSVDRTVQTVPLIFRKGRDLSDSPRKTSTRDIATVMLGAGKADAGVYHEEVNAPAVAGRRRIEGYVSNGNIVDPGTLNAFTEVSLNRVVNPKMEKTHGLEFARNKSPQPVRDFNVGDWAFNDVGKGLERLRIKQWVLSLAADGRISGSVTMNDMFAEAEEKLAKRVEGIVGGSTITGESRAEPVVPEETYDGIPPAAPTGLVVTSDAYRDDQGHTYAQASASWTAVAANADGTVMDDLAGYRVQWRYVTDGASTWRSVEAGGTTFTSWSPLSPGVNAFARVVAYDKAGNVSAASTQQPFTTAKDATPPEAPAAPTVDNYLGLLRIRNTGATASGAARADDEKGREVHVSTVNNFTPDLSETSTTRVDFLSAPGYSFVKAAYGTTMYAKLVAVDHSGNRSAASAQGSAASSPVLSADIFDGAVGSAKLADLAVTTAKINLLAVNNAQIGDVSAGKISAGLLSAVVTVSGRIATALTGARSELNAAGIQAFDSSGTLTIDLNGVNNLISGKYVTAITGRRIELGAAGLLGEINFYAPDGTRAHLRAYTESTGLEAMQMGIPISGATDGVWNKIHFNTDEWMQLHAENVDLHYLNGGFFAIRQRATRLSGAATVVKIQVDNLNTTFRDSGANVRLLIAGTGAGRFRIDINDFYMDGGTGDIFQRYNATFGSMFFSYGASVGDFNIVPNSQVTTADPYISPNLQLFTGQGVGCRIVSYDFTGFPLGVHIQEWNGSNYRNMYAAAFVVSSSETGKKNISDYGAGALAKVRAAKVKTWDRKGENTKKDGETVPREKRVEMGWIAEEAPPEVRIDGGLNGPMIDLGSQLAMVTSAVQELADIVDALKKGK